MAIKNMQDEKDNYLRNAELSVESNDNHIDGILNNAPIASAPESSIASQLRCGAEQMERQDAACRDARKRLDRER